jgi:hypothetical protein
MTGDGHDDLRLRASEQSSARLAAVAYRCYQPLVAHARAKTTSREEATRRRDSRYSGVAGFGYWLGGGWLGRRTPGLTGRNLWERSAS